MSVCVCAIPNSMIPFGGHGWVTIDRPILEIAHSISSQLRDLTGQNESSSSQSQVDTKPVEDTSTLQTKVESIYIPSLLPLLVAIKTDFPKWNGFSEQLGIIFQENNIDPRNRYKKFYSTEPADVVASYTWSGRSLFSLAGYCLAQLTRSYTIVVTEYFDEHGQKVAWTF